MRKLTKTAALKELTDQKFIGVIIFDNTKAFIANVYGYALLSSWESSSKSNNFSSPTKTLKEVIENHGQGIKQVIVFESAKDMFQWLSE